MAELRSNEVLAKIATNIATINGKYLFNNGKDINVSYELVTSLPLPNNSKKNLIYCLKKGYTDQDRIENPIITLYINDHTKNSSINVEEIGSISWDYQKKYWSFSDSFAESIKATINCGETFISFNSPNQILNNIVNLCNYSFYIWDDKWIPLSSGEGGSGIPGPQGPQGPKGPVYIPNFNNDKLGWTLEDNPTETILHSIDILPSISNNDNWIINGKDTNKPSKGTSIIKIQKIKTEKLIDTYQIIFSDGSTFEYTITNGTDGTDVIISKVEPSDTKVLWFEEL